MDPTGRVHARERFGDAARECDRVGDAHAVGNEIGEIRARDALHRDPRAAVGERAMTCDARDRAGRRERFECLGLAGHPRPRELVIGVRDLEHAAVGELPHRRKAAAADATAERLRERRRIADRERFSCRCRLAGDHAMVATRASRNQAAMTRRAPSHVSL